MSMSRFAGLAVGVVLVNGLFIGVAQAKWPPGGQHGGDQHHRNDGCTIVGTLGDDVLHGTSGDDVICGLRGDDRLYGGGGDDLILGGRGEDRIAAGAGHDHADGERGADLIFGGPAGDRLIGGKHGPDVVVGQGGFDRLLDFTIGNDRCFQDDRSGDWYDCSR